MKRRFAKNYAIVRALVFNPRTPLDLASGSWTFWSATCAIFPTTRKFRTRFQAGHEDVQQEDGDQQQALTLARIRGDKAGFPGNLRTTSSWLPSPAPDPIADLLQRSRTIAVGTVQQPAPRPSHGVSAYMQTNGYRIIPVDPKIRGSLGEKSYPSLLEVPEKIDIVSHPLRCRSL